MSLKTIEPIYSPLKTFENFEDFNDYYKLHKDEIDNETTHLLNKKYKIDGYRITKIKGETMLKKISVKNNNLELCSSGSSIRSNIENLENEINSLKNDFNGLVSTVNILINKFNDELCKNNNI